MTSLCRWEYENGRTCPNVVGANGSVYCSLHGRAAGTEVNAQLCRKINRWWATRGYQMNARVEFRQVPLYRRWVWKTYTRAHGAEVKIQKQQILMEPDTVGSHEIVSDLLVTALPPPERRRR
jgi:hypothetical protein